MFTNDQCDEEAATAALRTVERRRWLRRRITAGVIILVSSASLVGMGTAISSAYRAGTAPWAYLPADFEQHEAVLLGWDDRQHPQLSEFTVRAVAAIEDRVRSVVAVPDAVSRRRLERALRDAKIDERRVSIVLASFATPWLRDHGPRVVKRRTGALAVLETTSFHEDLPEARMPTQLARQWELDCVTVPMILEGGHVLSNGGGLCLTTRALLQVNKKRFGHEEPYVTKQLRRYLGATQVVYLEPLHGEPGGHVDMFATFTGPDTVVVGQYSPGLDPDNARVLDENARRLKKVMTASGPLRVERIAMPPRDGGHWRTYTNVLYANGVVLLPSYGEVDPAIEQQVQRTYGELLPGWDVVPVNCDGLIWQGGAVHCATLNLYRTSAWTVQR